ncbi:hypothetical protein [Streptomyces sp900116325]|uniref:hypothetical protein n=1 Tax=Streptomyces sp. 900116325 TaxID=3154295 RepID=UPI0033C5274F
MATPHVLRRKPIGELTVEDMGLLIGQNESLPTSCRWYGRSCGWIRWRKVNGRG